MLNSKPMNIQSMRAEAAEVARGVRLVGAAALPVRHPLGADHDLAESGSAPALHPLGVEGAGRHLAIGTADRGVGHVLDRQAVARVEEARRSARGSGSPATRARTHAMA